MRKQLIITGLTLLLAACAVVPENPQRQENEQTARINPQERIEVDASGTAELVSGTGALSERLLPTGVIDTGERDAPVILLLFTEHHARYARDFQQEHYPRLLKDFIEPGQVRFQIVILPLKKYPQSSEAAASLLCAAMQSKGILMHSILSEKLDRERLPTRDYAQEIGLNMEEFDKCSGSEEIQIILDQQKSWAKSLDVTLVPTFFINGEKHVGLPYYPDLRGMIDEATNQ